MKVLKMEEIQNEEEGGSLMTTFEQTMGNTSTTTTDEESEKDFQDRVRQFLSVSGIDAVLPLNCGMVSVANTLYCIHFAYQLKLCGSDTSLLNGSAKF